MRHNVGAAGRIGVSALQSPIAIKVYENPYATGVDRDSTDREVSGFRVSWDEIFGTGLEIRFSDREVDIDDENSGVGLGLTQAQIDSLDRNGDQSRINVCYLLAQSETSQLVVGINSTEADLDGDAMSYDSTSFEINWIYSPSKDFKLVTSLLGGQRDFDEANPVFGEKADTDFRSFSATAFFPGAFGFKDWIPNAAFAFGQEDSDVSFFDSKVQILSVGFLTRF